VNESRPLEGRSALITGANQGLGLAIARAYVSAGANVLLCARDAGRLDRARAEVATLAGSAQTVTAVAADISRVDDVNRVVQSALQTFPRLQILVNNAGVVGPIGRAEDVDWSEWARTIEINLLGSVLMCRALLAHFRSQPFAKIVQLSGGGATSPMPRFSAYAASKAAVVRFTETLAEELKSTRIDVNAIAPGAVNTRMLDSVLSAGADRAGDATYQRAITQQREGGAPPTKAAALAVFLASAASDGITGKLISAIWDPWETLSDHRDDLKGTDIYTLRRIVPADRNLKWPGT